MGFLPGLLQMLSQQAGGNDEQPSRSTVSERPEDAGTNVSTPGHGWSLRPFTNTGANQVNEELIIERLFQSLITGDRITARLIVKETRGKGISPEDLAHEIFWPVLETINKLFRADQLSMLAHHYAVRLFRSLLDQTQVQDTQQKRRGEKILMFCGASEADELSGMMVADLIEAAGYEVFFGGGGIASDEILAEAGEHRPDRLLMFASGPSDAPNIRVMIDHIREVGACPNMQIVVGGGVFNRADGLAEEIGADLWATNPRELLTRLEEEKHRRASSEQRTVGRNRRTPSVKAA